MSLVEQIQSIVAGKYYSADGDLLQLAPLPGLSAPALEAYEKRFPNSYLPAGIKSLLQYTSGIEGSPMDTISFNGEQFGFEDFFPFSVELAGDGAGNFWIVDVDDSGEWGAVFFVCHDPAVIVKQADNLSAFLQQLQEHLEEPGDGQLTAVSEQLIFNAWEHPNYFIDLTTARNSSDPALQDFAHHLPDHYIIADLRNQEAGAGFAWGKFDSAIENARRYNDDHLWGLDTHRQPPKPRARKKSFLERLLGR